MKNLLLYLLIQFFALSLQGQSSDGIQVKVMDQYGKPLSAEEVSVQGGDYLSTDVNGEFTLPWKSLHLPIRAEFRNSQLEVMEVAYFEEEGRVEIKGHRSYHSDDVLKISFRLQDAPLSEELQVLVKGQPYLASANKPLTLKEVQRFSPDLVEVKGFEIVEEQLDKKNHELKIFLKKQQVQQLQDTTMISYEADFERLTRELENERALFENRNQEVQQEVLKIRDKLLQEELISPDQRQELKHYLGNLEKVIMENSEVVRRSEERTKEAVAKLRMIILEKDSLNIAAQGRIEQMEQERIAAEESFNQKKVIYIGLIALLIIIALIIYFFAEKLRKQKSWLKEVNKRHKNMQQDLTQSLQELSLRKAQIEDHNHQLELFVYKASHDIKGPLRSIIGLTEIGLHDVKEEVAREYFQHIHKSTQRLDKLLADLLKLTKAKQAEVEKKKLDLAEMVHDIIQSFKNIRYFDRIAFTVNIPGEVEFRSDQKMLYSVLQNFVENGIKYCDPAKEQPFLNINIRQEPGKTSFLFEDNGLGIDQEHLPKIFDMFYKVDPASDGTGLGLHIVKVTIEKLGGSIKVNSRRGQGSLFTITFYD